LYGSIDGTSGTFCSWLMPLRQKGIPGRVNGQSSQRLDFFRGQPGFDWIRLLQGATWHGCVEVVVIAGFFYESVVPVLSIRMFRAYCMTR
jgi:hypothetical protein